MYSAHRLFSVLILTAGVTSSLAGCASRSAWDYSGEEANVRRNLNVLTREDMERYPDDYAVSRIVSEAFPGLWARNAAVGAGAPLVIVNGVPGSTLNDLRAWDIERIEAQYDAASTAYYGFQGNNGVILVTTIRVGTPTPTPTPEPAPAQPASGS